VAQRKSYSCSIRPSTLDKLRSMRRPGESYSDVIVGGGDEMKGENNNGLVQPRARV
jgi:hypothetical protein